MRTELGCFKHNNQHNPALFDFQTLHPPPSSVTDMKHSHLVFGPQSAPATADSQSPVESSCSPPLGPGLPSGLLRRGCDSWSHRRRSSGPRYLRRRGCGIRLGTRRTVRQQGGLLGGGRFRSARFLYISRFWGAEGRSRGFVGNGEIRFTDQLLRRRR